MSLGKYKNEIGGRVYGDDLPENRNVGIGSLMGETGRTTSNMDRRIADLGASQGMAPATQRMMLIQKTVADMGKVISEEDAKLFGAGEISFQEAMSRATPIPRSGAMAMQQPNAQLQMAEGGEADMDEVQSSLNELQEQKPEIDAMNQLIASVVEMVMSGVSEEEIMQFLSSKGLDDEEIEMVLEAVAEQLMQQQGGIQEELSAIG